MLCVLSDPSTRQGFRLPIDLFLRSLAADQREKGIGIVLSGSGTDGTLGLKAIKSEFGLAMVQAPETAKFRGMPTSAIDTGIADFILPPPRCRLNCLLIRHTAPAKLRVEQRAGWSGLAMPSIPSFCCFARKRVTTSLATKEIRLAAGLKGA